MRRRLVIDVPAIPAGKCYWPGFVHAGFDPLVDASFVQETCAAKFRSDGAVSLSDPRHWRNDPTYDLRAKKARSRR